MSKYENLGRQQPATDYMPGRVLVGQFACQHCEEMVDEARFRPVEKTLAWICSGGHVSMIEDFDIH